jgi:uncharacterized protein (DUF488 family)
MTIWTIGHSTHPIEEFIAILLEYKIKLLADVRTVPRSRMNPQFNTDVLPGSLAAFDIEYIHLKDLGGLRHTNKHSINTAWRNASFRGYADYMQTPEFASAIDGLIGLAKKHRTAIMCAEAVPWRCHRSLIGDALLVRGVEVVDIFSATEAKPHSMTSFAEVSGLKITYPKSPEQKNLFSEPEI